MPPIFHLLVLGLALGTISLCWALLAQVRVALGPKDISDTNMLVFPKYAKSSRWGLSQCMYPMRMVSRASGI